MDRPLGGGGGGGAGKSVEDSGTRRASNSPPLDRHSDEPVRLARNLGLLNGVAMMVSAVVGSGIFIAPTGVLKEAGSPGASLLVWTSCGLLCLLGALCMAELACSVRCLGGEYAYIKLAYGPLPAFLYLWVTFTIILPCSNAIAALTFAQYVLQPFYLNESPACTWLAGLLTASAGRGDGLLSHSNQTSPPLQALQASSQMVVASPESAVDGVAATAEQAPERAIQLLALACLTLLTYVNCTSVKLSIRIQNWLAFTKLFALALVISMGGAALWAGPKSNRLASEPDALWKGSQTNFAHLAQALYAAFYTFAGWNSLNCVTEEMRDPVKNMPRAIILSITGITLIYILTNAAYFTILTPQEILRSEAIGILFGQRALGHSLAWLMPLVVALSTIGGLNSGLFSASRILVAGARQSQLPKVFQTIHHTMLTPIAALLLLCLLSALYLFQTNIMDLINQMIFIEASFAALGVSTLLRLRHKMPNIERPLKVHLLVPILYLTFSSLLVLLPVYLAPKNAAIGLAITLSGVPVFYLTANWQNKPAPYQNALDHLNCIIQKLTASLDQTQDYHIESQPVSSAKPSNASQ